MSEQKFFRCQHCGNLVGMIHDAGVPMICCGEVMQALTCNTTEAAVEKHLPVVTVKERLIHTEVGSVAHPMTNEHHIEFIYLQTEQGGQMKRLCVDANPSAIFAVLNDSAVAVFAYCNLHGLWKSEACTPCTHPETEQPTTDSENETTCSPEFTKGCK